MSRREENNHHYVNPEAKKEMVPQRRERRQERGKNKTNTDGAVCLDMYAEDIKCTNLSALLAWRYWLKVSERERACTVKESKSMWTPSSK